MRLVKKLLHRLGEYFDREDPYFPKRENYSSDEAYAGAIRARYSEPDDHFRFM